MEDDNMEDKEALEAINNYRIILRNTFEEISGSSSQNNFELSEIIEKLGIIMNDSNAEEVSEIIFKAEEKLQDLGMIPPRTKEIEAMMDLIPNEIADEIIRLHFKSVYDGMFFAIFRSAIIRMSENITSETR